jgi:hypothetical protein
MLTKTALIFDLTLAMFAVILVMLNPHLASNILPSWILFSLSAALVTHLLSIYWAQLTRNFRKFSEYLLRHASLHFVADIFYCLAVLIATFTGLLIANDKLEMMGVQPDAGTTEKATHSQRLYPYFSPKKTTHKHLTRQVIFPRR